MLRVLLNRFHEGSIETLLHPLPEEDVQNILRTEIVSKEIHPALARPGEVLSKIHYTWLSAPLLRFPEALQPYLLGSLEEIQCKKMISFLNFRTKIPKLSSFSRRYFQDLLYTACDLEEILPIEYLPQHSLTPLAAYDKQELIKVIDLLGTYDLCAEIRQQISKKKINLIYNALPEHAQQFLKIAFHQQDKLTPYVLGTELWNGDKAKLMNRLQRAGMRRLSFACIDLHPDILWHITHTLDQGRGSIIKRDIPQEPKKGISPAVIVQTVNTMKFLEKSGAEL